MNGTAKSGERHNKGITEVVTVQQREYKLWALCFVQRASDLGGHVIKQASKAHLAHYVISLVCECGYAGCKDVCACVGGLIVTPSPQ